MTLAMTAADSAYLQVNPRGPFVTGLPAWADIKSLRTKYLVESSDPMATPNLRFLTLGYTSAGNLAPVYWGDAIDLSNVRNLVTPAAAGLFLPGSYKPGGQKSLLEFYAPHQYAGTGENAATLAPTVDLLEPVAVYPINGWGKPSATVTITGITVERIDD